MKFKIQLTITHPDNKTEIIQEIISLDKPTDSLEEIGLSLLESKQILQSIQEKVVQQQTDKFIENNRRCECCQKKYRKKGSYPIVYRTLFGDIPIQSPRFYKCNCEPSNSKTFSPLTTLITEHTSPERLYLETKWAATLPFGKTVALLKDVLPISEKLNAASIKNHLTKVVEKEESELGEEQPMFIEGCQMQWEKLPRPDLPITVGLDGGYLRNWVNKKTYFEVIAGKSIPSTKAEKFFAFVDTYAPSKPKRRLFETLKSQGLQSNQQLEFLSDGATNLQELQKYLNPDSEHYLDWFHITMKITVLQQYLKGMIKVDQETAEEYQQLLEKIKWYLWHGNIIKALYYLDDLAMVDFIENEYQHLDGFKKHVEQFGTYITNNQHYITNYGERQRNGEVYTTSFAESTINKVVARRFCKKQQMQWSKKGAHLMLQARTQVLNGDWRAVFKKWYPKLKFEEEQTKKAA